jgi:hypothetical protein
MVAICVDRSNAGDRGDAHDRKNLRPELEQVDRDGDQQLVSGARFAFLGDEAGRYRRAEGGPLDYDFRVNC